MFRLSTKLNLLFMCLSCEGRIHL